MYEEIFQGDILRVEKIKCPVVVVSKDFFNTSGEVIACQIFELSTRIPLHILVNTKEVAGYVQCEKMTLLDLKVRGYKKIDKLKLLDKMNISDAVQGIFEYA